jgi:hypothetical protein
VKRTKVRSLDSSRKRLGKGVRLDLFSIMLMQLQYSEYSLTEYVLEICSILGEPFEFLTELPTNVERPIVQVVLGICNCSTL